MININKKLVKPTAFVLGIIMLGLLSVSYASYVSAQDSENYPSIVKKIAEKFNLNEKDVQAVFDEERIEHYADMQARLSERLDDLVSEGKITQEQKNALIKKHEEMHNQMLELKDLDLEERKAKMRELHEDFKQWSEEQGIDLPGLGHFKFGMRHGGIHDKKMMMFNERI